MRTRHLLSLTSRVDWREARQLLGLHDPVNAEEEAVLVGALH